MVSCEEAATIIRQSLERFLRTTSVQARTSSYNLRTSSYKLDPTPQLATFSVGQPNNCLLPPSHIWQPLLKFCQLVKRVTEPDSLCLWHANTANTGKHWLQLGKGVDRSQTSEIPVAQNRNRLRASGLVDSWQNNKTWEPQFILHWEMWKNTRPTQRPDSLWLIQNNC